MKLQFFPEENIVYKTELKEDEILKRLADNIQLPSVPIFRFMFGKPSLKLSQGKISGHTFEIKRDIPYMNSFRPNIKGVIEGSNVGAIIKVKMQIVVYIKVFLFFWLGMMTLFAASMTWKSIFERFNAEMFFPYIMFIVAYGIMWAGFTSESSQTKEDLKIIFKARI